jgi:hypothetical protein
MTSPNGSSRLQMLSRVVNSALQGTTIMSSGGWVTSTSSGTVTSRLGGASSRRDDSVAEGGKDSRQPVGRIAYLCEVGDEAQEGGRVERRVDWSVAEAAAIRKTDLEEQCIQPFLQRWAGQHLPATLELLAGTCLPEDLAFSHELC